MFPSSPGILPDKEAKERLTLPHSENISAPPLLPLCVCSYVLLFTSSFSPFVTWESGHSFPFPNGSPLGHNARNGNASPDGRRTNMGLADGGGTRMTASPVMCVGGRERVNILIVDRTWPLCPS